MIVKWWNMLVEMYRKLFLIIQLEDKEQLRHEAHTNEVSHR